MHCNGCATKIKKNLATIGIDQTEVDVANGKVKVIYDSEKSVLTDVKNKITEVGFQVESVELE